MYANTVLNAKCGATECKAHDNTHYEVDKWDRVTLVWPTTIFRQISLCCRHTKGFRKPNTKFKCMFSLALKCVCVCVCVKMLKCSASCMSKINVLVIALLSRWFFSALLWFLWFLEVPFSMRVDSYSTRRTWNAATFRWCIYCHSSRLAFQQLPTSFPLQSI